MAGAQPTLTGITDDASRGGLFDRSNIASPVSGADVSGTIINDSTITLTIQVGDTTETRTFTTNEAADTTLSFDFSAITGGGSGGGVDGVVSGGSFDASTGVLTLQRTNSLSDVTITGFTFSTLTEADVNRLADARIGAANIQDLNNVPAIGSSGQVLSVASDGMNLEYVNPATAAVSSSSFTSTGSTVAITQNGANVNLESRPEWEGNTNNAPAGTIAVTTDVEASRIVLGADTGLVLVDSGSGVYTIRAQAPAPTPAEAPTSTTPPPSSAISPSPQQVDYI